MALAGKESPLRRRHKVYLDVVSVATAPENYVDRLVPLCSCCWKRLKLFVLEARDTSLTVPAYRGSPANRSSPIHCLSEVEKCVLHSDPNQTLNWKLDFAGFNSVYSITLTRHGARAISSSVRGEPLSKFSRT